MMISKNHTHLYTCIYYYCYIFSPDSLRKPEVLVVPAPGQDSQGKIIFNAKDALQRKQFEEYQKAHQDAIDEANEVRDVFLFHSNILFILVRTVNAII